VINLGQRFLWKVLDFNAGNKKIREQFFKRKRKFKIFLNFKNILNFQNLYVVEKTQLYVDE
jgi:hypothetical protein